MSGIIIQISNYAYFVIYILGEIIGYQKYYRNCNSLYPFCELLYPFVIWFFGELVLLVYCAIRGIRMSRMRSNYRFNKYKPINKVKKSYRKFK